MKIGDSVIFVPMDGGSSWDRVGLVLGFGGANMVFVFWGADYPYEEEYYEQLAVM